MNLKFDGDSPGVDSTEGAHLWVAGNGHPSPYSGPVTYRRVPENLIQGEAWMLLCLSYRLFRDRQLSFELELSLELLLGTLRCLIQHGSFDALDDGV